MKRGALPLAILAAGALAQDPEDTTTITYSVCPTATTTTITLSSTITYCPGGFCNVTPSPGPDTTTVTSTKYITVYPAPCPYGKKGMCDATYTISEDCPCTKHHDGYIPQDFTTTIHKCNSCGEDGGPTTITQTLPCTTGAYATVTPAYGGKWTGPKPEQPIEDDGSNGGNGGPGGADKPVADAEGSAPGGAPAGGAPAGGAGAGGAGAGGAPAGGAPAGGSAPGGGSPAGGADRPVADAEGSAPGGAPAGGAPAGGAGAGGAPAGGSAPGGGSPAGGAEGSDANGVNNYTGSANKAAFALSTVFAGVVGALAIML